jgi:hypothetical protein
MMMSGHDKLGLLFPAFVESTPASRPTLSSRGGEGELSDASYFPAFQILSSNPSTKRRLPRRMMRCPSFAKLRRWPATPPGYLGLISPVDFKVRHHGVKRFFPSAAASSAAWAAIYAKMPVVIGQAIVARCLRASRLRISSMVITLPRGTRRMIRSTSIGAAMTNVPSPQLLRMEPVMGLTRGKPLLSRSFSCQLFRCVDMARGCLDASDSAIARW